MYLDDVEPVLREGMDFLRDQGGAIGCYANRYMRVLGADGEASEKSYGQSWWKSSRRWSAGRSRIRPMSGFLARR